MEYAYLFVVKLLVWALSHVMQSPVHTGDERLARKAISVYVFDSDPKPWIPIQIHILARSGFEPFSRLKFSTSNPDLTALAQTLAKTRCLLGILLCASLLVMGT